MSGHMASRRGIVRRAVDRPPWNKVYDDLAGGGGVAFAVQPHREVRPGSWLVKAYHITTPFWAESGKEGKREHGG